MKITLSKRIGLLAFLLAFTFGLAADSFHARKVALLEEVKAIRSTYLLADVVAVLGSLDIVFGEVDR